MYRPARPLCALLAACGLAACATDSPSAPGEGHAASHASAPSTSAGVNRELAALRATTAPFHNFEKALEAGYATAITPCWEHRSLGAMGYHYGDPALIDGTVELLKPEVLMYEPNGAGHMRLVGMEYIVPLAAWKGDSPPTLLGQHFHPHSSLPIYKLHIWLWRHNPRGLFADWNPGVSCEHAAETEFFE